MIMASPVQRILSDMIRIPGISAIFVISKEGFVVERTASGAINIDDDAVAAMVTAVYGSVTQLGSELDMGKPEIITLEVSGHYFLIYDIGGEHVLAVMADRNQAMLGRVRYEIKKQGPRIAGVL